MPEFDYFSTCAAVLGPHHVSNWTQHIGPEESRCDCPAFKFTKGFYKWCKHLREIWENGCAWQGAGNHPCCPECGGPVSVELRRRVC